MTSTTSATYDRAVAVALTQSEWSTVRCALISYANDQATAGNPYWAARLLDTYKIIANQTT